MDSAAWLYTLCMAFLIVSALIVLLYRMTRSHFLWFSLRRKDSSYPGLEVIATLLIWFGKLVWLGGSVHFAYMLFIGIFLVFDAPFPRGWLVDLLGWGAAVGNPLMLLAPFPPAGFVLIIPSALIGTLFYLPGAYLRLQIDRNEYLREIARRSQRAGRQTPPTQV
jgi:hypothetical protein